MSDLYNPMLDDDEDESYYIQDDGSSIEIQEFNNEFDQVEDWGSGDSDSSDLDNGNVTSDDLYNPMLDDDEDEVVVKPKNKSTVNRAAIKSMGVANKNNNSNAGTNAATNVGNNSSVNNSNVANNKNNRNVKSSSSGRNVNPNVGNDANIKSSSSGRVGSVAGGGQSGVRSSSSSSSRGSANGSKVSSSVVVNSSNSSSGAVSKPVNKPVNKSVTVPVDNSFNSNVDKSVDKPVSNNAGGTVNKPVDKSRSNVNVNSGNTTNKKVSGANSNTNNTTVKNVGNVENTKKTVDKNVSVSGSDSGIVSGSGRGSGSSSKGINKPVDKPVGSSSAAVNTPVDKSFNSNVDKQNDKINKNASSVDSNYNPMLDDDEDEVSYLNKGKYSVGSSSVDKSSVGSGVDSGVGGKEDIAGRRGKKRSVFVSDDNSSNSSNNASNSNNSNNSSISGNVKGSSKRSGSASETKPVKVEPVKKSVKKSVNKDNGSNNISGSDNVSVSKMRSGGTFRDGRVVEPGDWNKVKDGSETRRDDLSYVDLDSDVYSGDGVDRSLGVPVDGKGGGVGDRYVERSEAKAKNKKKSRVEFLDSEFNFSASSVVDVNSNSGVPVSFESSFLNKYNDNDNDMIGRNNGAVSKKINNREINFFKNLGYGKKEFFDSGSLLSVSGVDVSGVDDEVLEKSRKRIDRALGGAKGLRSKSKFSFSPRDGEILVFLAMFKYANAEQLARMFSTSANSVRNNLRRLERSGLVVREKVVNTSALWFLTDAGSLLSGLDLPRTTRSKVNWSMFPHQFTVNYVAANLWGSNLNVLNLDDFPSKNKIDIKGNRVFGESLLSELAIQSSFGKFKIGSRADIYRPQLLSKLSSDFDEWRAAGGSSFGPSPEFFEGNEWMWILLDTGSDLNYHVPDLVVKRDRNEDDSPASIAVEIELANKDWDSYMRTLTAYHKDTRVYDKVIWVCKGLGTAEKLEKVAKTIGLWQSGRISIVPILTEDGIFKGDLWAI